MSLSSIQRNESPTYPPQRGMAAYEQLKAQWIRSNQFATHEQYEQAMREIARKCGV